MTITERISDPRSDRLWHKPTIWLATFALRPIAAISLLGRHYSAVFAGIIPRT